MAKTKVQSKDCIKAIQASVEGGELSEAQAKKLIADLTSRAKYRAQAKHMKLEDALKAIEGEFVVYTKMATALEKRNRLLAIKRTREFVAFAQTRPQWSDGVEKYLRRVHLEWRGLEAKFMSRLFSELTTAGVWDDFRKGLHAQDIYKEMFELSRGAAGKPGISGNEKAAKIAGVYHGIKRELNAIKNRHGAFTVDAVGHITIQTHDVNLLRLAGAAGWGKASQEQSFRVWRAFVDALDQDGGIDWERTLDEGMEKEKFLREFHRSIYNRVFSEGDETEVDVDQFRRNGSLASRISAGRVFWFKNADAAYKYNERWGSKSFNEAVVSDIHNSTRNASLLMHFGPNPDAAFRNGIGELLALAKDRDDSAKQVDELKRDRLKAQFRYLTGLANISERPGVSRFVDNLKAWTILSKGGGIAITSIADKAFMQNVMAYHGMKALDRFAAQIDSLTPDSPEKTAKLREISFLADSMISEIAARWVDDIRPSRALQRGLHWMFEATGLTLQTKKNRRAVAGALSHMLADEANLPFEALPKVRQQNFKLYDISPTEWNIWRKYTSTYDGMDGESRVLTPADVIDAISNEELDAISTSRGLTANSSNRARMRDELDAKLRAFFADVVTDAVPEPGLKERAFLTGGLARGTFWRETLDLLTVFKGFPVAVAMRMYGREKMAGEGIGVKNWLFSGHKGKFRVITLIAEATALGYLSMSIKDALKGRKRKQLFDDEGRPNVKVWLAAMQRGGGLGIYGDFLFSEYDMRMRDMVSAISGPVISQLNPMADILTSARSAALDKDGPEAESVLYKMERFAEDNVPFMNMFWIRPVLDTYIFYSLREALSPGVMRRHERSIEGQNLQEFYISPSEVANLETEEKLPYIIKSIVE